MLIESKGRHGQGGPSLCLSGGPVGNAGASIQDGSSMLQVSRLRWRSVGMLPQSSQPEGYREGGAWSLASAAGGLAAHTEGTSASSATAAGGKNAEGSSAGASTTTATGSLIASSTGSSTGSSTTTATAFAAAQGAGSSAGVSTATASIGAKADLIGTAVGASTTTATMTAIGHLAGEATPFTELSPQSLATAVWSALAADNAEPGTMGELLNGAGGGSSPGAVADAVWDELTAGHAGAGTFAALVQQDVYTAKARFIDDDLATTDRYVISWHKNGSVVTSGVTSPTIRVVKVSDGTDLIATSTMVEISGLSRFRYDAVGAARVASGSSYLAIFSATIDGVVRSWDYVFGRDSG